MIEHLLEWISTVDGNRALDLGTGDGSIARWLVAQGFVVDAVDRDLSVIRASSTSMPAQKIHLFEQDLRRFNFPPDIYSVIAAGSVLHFLLPSELPHLIDCIVNSMAPGGLLACEVLTQDDPEWAAFVAEGMAQIEPDTFPIRKGESIHYFASGELIQRFSGLETLQYSEERHADPGGRWGYRSLAVLLARKSFDASEAIRP